VDSGKRRDALPLLERAAALEPQSLLFRFRLAETRYHLSGSSTGSALSADIADLLALLSAGASGEEGLEGWVHNFIAQIRMEQGDLGDAAAHLEEAASILGEGPEIRVNRATLFYMKGSLQEALGVLRGGREDPDGIMGNCGGSLLFRAGDYEEAELWYRQALAAAPDNTEYLCNRAACLIKLGRYGEADDILTQAPLEEQDHWGQTGSVLALIADVALQTGEDSRSEAASRAALDQDGESRPPLFILGEVYSTLGRWDSLEEVLSKLRGLDLRPDERRRMEALSQKLEEGRFVRVTCKKCGRFWLVEREGEDVPPIRIFAMPPDDLPAGSCNECGETYCIGCVKETTDDQGRFHCPVCGRALKLSREGLRLVYNWAHQ
jgi:tetratricopeptide (TPR) repeat protein